MILLKLLYKTEDFENEKESNDKAGIPGISSLRKQLTTQANDLRDMASKQEFFRGQIDQLNKKIFALEKQVKDNLKEKEILTEKILMMELQIGKKKTKIQMEKKENKDLIEKLGFFVDKDTVSKNMMRNKNDDFEKYKISNREKEKDLQIKFNIVQQENTSLLDKILVLNQEITRLNDLLEIYNISRPSNNRIDSLTNIEGKNFKARSPLMNEPYKKELNSAIKRKSIENTLLKSPRLALTFNFNNEVKEIEDHIKLNELKAKEQEKEKEKEKEIMEKPKEKNKEESEKIEESKEISEKVEKINEENKNNNVLIKKTRLIC